MYMLCQMLQTNQTATTALADNLTSCLSTSFSLTTSANCLSCWRCFPSTNPANVESYLRLKSCLKRWTFTRISGFSFVSGAHLAVRCINTRQLVHLHFSILYYLFNCYDTPSSVMDNTGPGVVNAIGMYELQDVEKKRPQRLQYIIYILQIICSSTTTTVLLY